MNKEAIAEILEPQTAEKADSQEQQVRANFWRTVRRSARQIPYMDEIAAAYFAALDPRTPFRVRATLLGALAYFVMPFDLVPDLLALVGFSDDMAVLAATIATVRASITPAHRAAAKRALEDEGQQSEGK